MENAEANTETAKKPRLLELVRDAIRRRHYSRRTEQVYVHWIRRFIYFSGRRHPAGMGAPEVTAFLNHLARERNAQAAPRACRRFLRAAKFSAFCRRCAARSGSWRACFMARD